MSKIGFEMAEEERVLKVLDTITDISIAQFTEGFTDSVLSQEESDKLSELLIEVFGITSRALGRYNKR